MSASVESPADTPQSEARRDRRPALVLGARDALVVAVWFAVMGVVGAVVWWQVTSLPLVTKSGDSATLAPEQLIKQVAIDGWFFTVAAIGGLLSGVILMAWRHRDPLLMVVLLALGGGLAAWLMTHVGLVLGPEKELTALRAVADGGQVSMRLKLHAPGMVYLWPIGALLGSAVYLWVLKKPAAAQPSAATLS